jgi:ribosomal protein L37E
VSEDTVETVRVCRECGEEYRPDILVCADCGGELETRRADEEVARPPAQEAAETEAVEGYHAAFATSRAKDLVPLCERLRVAGLEYRLAERAANADEGLPARYSLLVPEAAAAQAIEALAELIAPHETGGDMRAIQDGFDHQQQGYLQCPACGAKTAADAKECPECGLGLGAADE